MIDRIATFIQTWEFIMINIIKNYFKPYQGLPREIYVIFIARMINAMGVFVFPLLMILMKTELDMTPQESGFVMMIGGFLYTFSSLIGGKLADTIGRKKVIVIFDALAAMSYVACALTPISKMTLVFIMAAMFFFGLSDPAHSALIADLSNKENRERAFSLTYLGFNLGFAIGPTIGGLLFSKKLFVIFFMGDAITALIAIGLVLKYIPETLGMTKDDESFSELEKRVEGSVVSVLLKRPVLIVFSVIMLGYSFVYEQWSFLMPLHAATVYGDSGAALYGMLASFNGIIVIAFTPYLTSKLAGKRNTQRIFVGGLFYLLGFGILGFVATKAAFFTTVFLMTLGEIIVVISFTPYIVNHTPASHRGRMNSVLPMLIGLGHTVGPFIMGTLLETITIPKAWNLISIIMMVAMCAMYMLDQTEKGKVTSIEAQTETH